MSLATLSVLFSHSAETRGLVVRVAVSFLPEQSDPSSGRWFWPIISGSKMAARRRCNC